mgnify:CR=1 FL=1
MHDTLPLSGKPLLSTGLPVNSFPIQDLWRFDGAKRRSRRKDASAPWRRLFIFGGAAFLTAYLTHEFFQILNVGGLAQLVNVDEIRGIPVGPLIDRALGQLTLEQEEP